MNSKLNDINEIINICDKMAEHVSAFGNIRPANELYASYRERINSFLRTNDLLRGDYGPCEVLNTFYYDSSKPNASLNLNEIALIRKVIVDMKHEIYPNCFEKIFISHREKNKNQVAAFMDLLFAIGIPRPVENSEESVIFCTSHPATYIENGHKNLSEIRSQFSSHFHIFYILWYTDEYFESQACLNEAGAIWVTDKRYQEILSPAFDNEKIGGLLDRQPVWMRANDKYRLNTFKAQLENFFDLTPITQNSWEIARDTFIDRINTMTESERGDTDGR